MLTQRRRKIQAQRIFHACATSDLYVTKCTLHMQFGIQLADSAENPQLHTTSAIVIAKKLHVIKQQNETDAKTDNKLN